MQFEYTTTVDAKNTDTVGSHTYLVALRTGGLQECPNIEYVNFQFIRAESAEEAREKYNSLNKCSFYYGEVLDEVIRKG